tara:strand:- start:328 stop:483 length:156 start_codon:yes stop_codon:yes gene_type:complete
MKKNIQRDTFIKTEGDKWFSRNKNTLSLETDKGKTLDYLISHIGKKIRSFK